MADTKKYLHNLDVSGNKVTNLILNPVTTAQRIAIGGTLSIVDQGYVVFDINTNQQFFWNGFNWILASGGGGQWGLITGTITAQTDLINYLTSNYYPLSSNPAGYLTSAAANLLYYPLSSNPAGYLTSSSIAGMVTGNGTLNYIPKWTPLGTQLGDSTIVDTGTLLQTKYSGLQIGFFLDYVAKEYWLGDYANGYGIVVNEDSVLGNITIGDMGAVVGSGVIKIDTANSIIETQSGAGTVGYQLDFQNFIYRFGDYYGGNNNTYLIIDDALSTIISYGSIQHNNLAGSGTRMVTADSTGLLSTTTFTANGLRSGIAAGTDTYTVTIAGVTSYAVNDTYVIQFTNGNTGASTLNINGLGAITLFKYNDVPVLAGDIGAGHQFIVSYDGTNFELIGIRPNQLFAFITNNDSVTINKGQPVYAFGAAGNRMSVKLANNTADATSAKTLGLVFSSSIAPNQTGFIIIQGVIENINTAAYSPGDTLYLGASAGALTNVKPYAPNHLVYIGIVERANAGNGQIYVRTQNGYELDEIHDVDLITTPPTNNQVLAYETSSGLWKNKSLSAVGAGTVTSVSASMVTPAQTVSVTNPTTTPAISIDDTNLLYNKFMVNQYSYMFPSDANTLWDTLRVGGTILSTGTVSALSETPMGQLFTTATAVGSVAGLFGTSFGGSGYLGTNFEFDFSYRFRINTNNGAQRLFCGVSSQYATATPTNVEPTTLINSIGVAKLQATANLYFVWNDATGTASSFDLGSGFLGTDTTSTYRMRIYKTSGIASINLELTKVTSGGTVTVTSLNITSDYNTGSTMYPVIWMGNNTAATGAVSFKNYGCQIIKRGLVNA